MGKARKPKVRVPKIAAQRRAALVVKVAELMANGDPTKFAHEGDAIHGLRGGFLLAGVLPSWRAADLVARDVVAAALAKLGAQRPTWAEGQREFVDPVSDRCVRCHRWIDRDDEDRRRRYCSTLCKVAHQKQLDRLLNGRAVRARTRAKYHALKASAAIEPCAVCGKGIQRSPKSQAVKAGRRPVCSHSCRGKLAAASRREDFVF